MSLKDLLIGLVLCSKCGLKVFFVSVRWGEHLCSQGDTQTRSCLVHLPKYTQFLDFFFPASPTGCQRNVCQGEILYDEILPHLLPLTRTLLQGWGWIVRQKGGARVASRTVPHLPVPAFPRSVWRFDFLCSEGKSQLCVSSWLLSLGCFSIAGIAHWKQQLFIHYIQTHPHNLWIYILAEEY